MSFPVSRRTLIASVPLLVLPRSGALALEASPVSAAEFAHPDWLIDPSDLRVEIAKEQNLKVVALTPVDEYSAAHIPGAVQVDWPALEIVETSDQRVTTWRTAVEELISNLGLTFDDRIVVYDGGTFYASRFWWVLHQLGHVQQQILDGGLTAWIAAGFQTAAGVAPTTDATAVYAGEPDESAIATVSEVVDALDDANVVLIDARTPGEYEAGHIPSALNIPFTDNAESGEIKRWKTPMELFALYQERGVTPERKIIPYCTTGVRSAATFFTLRLLGYENVALFTGSYKEWTASPGRPVETETGA